MLHRIFAFLGLILFALGSIEARAAEPIVLAPSTPWVLDYDEDMCSLRRMFGTGENRTLLVFESLSQDPGMKMTLAGNLMKAWKSPVPVKVRFGPSDLGEFIRSGAPGRSNRGEPVLDIGSVTINANWLLSRALDESQAEWTARAKNWTKPSLTEMAADEQRATELSFEREGRLKLLLQTGRMSAPLSGLRECVDDMIRGWGIDPEVQRNLSLGAVPANNPGTWVYSADYPSKMLSESQSALVYFRLIVGMDGKVINCAIQTAAGPSDFRDWTCAKILSRARFRPALDAAGKPVKSFWRSSVRWTSPPG